MKDDIRYSEFTFLRALAKRDPKFEHLNVSYQEQQAILGLPQIFYAEMLVALAEDGHIVFDHEHFGQLIGRLRGEISEGYVHSKSIHDHEWSNPRDAIHNKLIGTAWGSRVRITYRGLCRLEDLREVLKRDRILEPFGVLLDLRYFPRDLEEALHRPDLAVSVIRLDLDAFKRVNDEFGHAAGDVVMKAYLETVRDCLGSIGTGYRGRGDEVAALVVSQDHERSKTIAEQVRRGIENLELKHNELRLPGVTASIGVATSPPEARRREIESLSDARQRRAKKEGKKSVWFLTNGI